MLLKNVTKMPLKVKLYFCKNLLGASILCFSVLQNLSEVNTLGAVVILCLAAFYAAVPFAGLLRGRKTEVEADGMAVTGLVLFGMAFYHYATGEFPLFFVAGLVYVAVNVALLTLVRRDRGRCKKGKNTGLLFVLSVLMVALFVASPLAWGFDVPLSRVVVYIVVVALPLLYFCGMILPSKDKWERHTANEILMGQSLATASFVIGLVNFSDVREQEPRLLLPMVLAIALCAVDLLVSSFENKN